jgi:hypothetical protein
MEMCDAIQVIFLFSPFWQWYLPHIIHGGVGRGAHISFLRQSCQIENVSQWSGSENNETKLKQCMILT